MLNNFVIFSSYLIGMNIPVYPTNSSDAKELSKGLYRYTTIITWIDHQGTTSGSELF